MRHAHIETIHNSGDFSARLKATGKMNLIVETYQEVSSTSGITGVELSLRFNQLFNEMPSDLIFRAYDAEREYSWYGEEGVCVTLSGDGKYDANSVSINNHDASFPALVTEIVYQNRIIYRKLGGVVGETE